MPVTPEFSRLISVEGIIPGRPRKDVIEASAEECAALAKRFGLVTLSGFKGKITILRIAEGNIIRVEGDIEADVVQTCVVSLQDVPSRVQTNFDTSFTEAGEVFEQELGFDMEIEEDLYEVLNEGVLDIGELAAQYLSLELDPYPRAPGVSLAAQLAESGGDAKNRPFQVLQGLKTDKEE